MPTPFEKLYENILPKFKSYEIPQMWEQQVKEYLYDYITPACAQFHTCRKNLYDRDIENEQFNEDLTDEEIDILGNFMVIVMTDSTYIRTPTLLKANLSSSDFNAFSPANMLDKLTAMHNDFLSQNEALLSRYSWSKKNQEIGNLIKIASERRNRKKWRGYY